ncbi:cell cycle checkpoint [Coprinellus micaceus]|uniref:Checkpoint protein n=1 Tax=Coprinellus micaceus TaxID=71717 RepID=A0A4Y7TDB5_COPMI|nr:cell cycle checkpoint [Coprinellus micaceus]
MRFRANIENVPLFFRVIQTLEKLQKKLIIKFTEETMHLICNHETNEGGIQVWSQMRVPSLFTKYRIQSNAKNEITMNLYSDALLGALRSAAANPASALNGAGNTAGAPSSIETDEVIVRLTKKNDQAMLSFEITGTTRLGRLVRVVHDVRIEVLKPADAARLAEPLCPTPNVHILLPPLHKLRTIVERLRPMSNILAIRANSNGHLQLGINTEGVKLETDWRNCTNPSNNDGNEPEDEEDEEDLEERKKMYAVIVSIKSFLKFLGAHQVSTTTIACVCQHHCLILYVYIGDVADAGGVLTFYVPAVIDE